MKHLFAIILLLTGQGAVANMASPVRPGTYCSSAFSSRDVDILWETIRITPAADFKTATFSIEYHIQTDSDGKQVPLLFHAIGYKGDIQVQLDGQDIPVQPIPDSYLQPGSALANAFPAFTGSSSGVDSPKLVFWDKEHHSISSPNDLKYFEVDLGKGEHRIRVDYTATVWTDLSGWVKAYSFRYSLSPARYWRSFGELHVQLDTSTFTGAWQTNLGDPASRQGSQLNWHFSELPGDYITIGYTPPISLLARLLIRVGPLWLSLAFAILLTWLHIVLIMRYRRQHPEKTVSWVLILGGIIIPFLMLAGLPYAYDIIDRAIGPEAGRHHGYTFLVIGLYPLLLAVYGLIMWWIDRLARRKLAGINPGQ